MGSECQAISMMRLQTFFALLLIVHVCSAQNGLLNQINTLKKEVETCKTEVKTLKTSCLAFGPFPCGDVNAESGKIQSFNYPNDYPNNEDCIWKITVPSGYNVMPEFETPFDIENDGSCSYDYLEIRDGGAATSPFLGEKLCGTTVPNTIKSTGNTMYPE